jgi:hypothetical protein
MRDSKGRFLPLEQHPNWKGNQTSQQGKRARARFRFALGNCELCDRKATDRHHKDSDTGNNDRSNIQILCRSCHMRVDGRTKKNSKRMAILSSKLNASQVADIRNLKGLHTIAYVAGMYGVHYNTIKNIWSGRTWVKWTKKT